MSTSCDQYCPHRIFRSIFHGQRTAHSCSSSHRKEIIRLLFILIFQEYIHGDRFIKPQKQRNCCKSNPNVTYNSSCSLFRQSPDSLCTQRFQCFFRTKLMPLWHDNKTASVSRCCGFINFSSPNDQNCVLSLL